VEREDDHAEQPLEIDVEPTPPHDDREHELDGLRIRQLSALRRSAYRARSFAIIVAVACLVVGIQLTVNAFAAAAATYRALFAALAVLALLGAIHFARRVAALQRELRTPPPMPPEPPGGPDFSTLSDGSQQWKNLEDIR
jgi:uncharacterized membrane protein YcjF (UPF0283 family)